MNVCFINPGSVPSLHAYIVTFLHGNSRSSRYFYLNNTIVTTNYHTYIKSVCCGIVHVQSVVTRIQRVNITLILFVQASESIYDRHNKTYA